MPQRLFVKGKRVGQYLAGMRQIGQRIDDRNRGVLRKSFNDGMIMQSGDNGVIVAGEQLCHILN